MRPLRYLQLAGISLLAGAAVGVGRAQISNLPPTIGSTADVYGTTTTWASQLTAVPGLTAGDHPIELVAGADGIAMGGAAPTGGSDVLGVRIIYLGSSTTADIDFGVVLGGALNRSQIALRNTDGPVAEAAVLGATMVADVGGTASSFRFWDLSLTPTMFSQFDIWMNVPGLNGGLYHAFHSIWDTTPNGPTGVAQSYWSQAFTLNTRTFDATSGTVQARATTTYLLSFEDAQDDDDRSDLVLGFQLLRKEGRTDAVNAVPEPAVTAAAGMLALSSLAAGRVRRRR